MGRASQGTTRHQSKAEIARATRCLGFLLSLHGPNCPLGGFVPLTANQFRHRADDPHGLDRRGPASLESAVARNLLSQRSRPLHRDAVGRCPSSRTTARTAGIAGSRRVPAGVEQLLLLRRRTVAARRGACARRGLGVLLQNGFNGHFRPLLIASAFVIRSSVGYESPIPFHLLAIALHVANVLLAYLVLVRLDRNLRAAAAPGGRGVRRPLGRHRGGLLHLALGVLWSCARRTDRRVCRAAVEIFTRRRRLGRHPAGNRDFARRRRIRCRHLAADRRLSPRGPTNPTVPNGSALSGFWPPSCRSFWPTSCSASPTTIAGASAICIASAHTRCVSSPTISATWCCPPNGFARCPACWF